MPALKLSRTKGLCDVDLDLPKVPRNGRAPGQKLTYAINHHHYPCYHSHTFIIGSLERFQSCHAMNDLVYLELISKYTYTEYLNQEVNRVQGQYARGVVHEL